LNFSFKKYLKIIWVFYKYKMSYWGYSEWNYGQSNNTNSNTCRCGKSIKKGQTMCGGCKSIKVTKTKNSGTRNRNLKTCRHCGKHCNAKKMYGKLCRICYDTMERKKERDRVTELRDSAIDKIINAPHICVKCQKNTVIGKYICKSCKSWSACAGCENKYAEFTGFLDLQYCSQCFSKKRHLKCFCKHIHSKCEGQFKCCVCRGQVPYQKEGTYSQYVDEVGMVECGQRWDKFCPTCKEFFDKLVVGKIKTFEAIYNQNPIKNTLEKDTLEKDTLEKEEETDINDTKCEVIPVASLTLTSMD